MASPFARRFTSSAWGVLHAVHGEDEVVVTVQPNGAGSATTVEAIVQRGAQLLETFPDARQQQDLVLVLVPYDAITSWTPSTLDAVTIDGVAHGVLQIAEPREPLVRLLCERRQTQRFGGSRHRVGRG